MFRDRALNIALVVSLGWHLLLLKMFTIVVVFPPVDEPPYLEFAFVKLPTVLSEPFLSGPGSYGYPLGRRRLGDSLHVAEDESLIARAEIQLPGLDFSKLEQLTIAARLTFSPEGVRGLLPPDYEDLYPRVESGFQRLLSSVAGDGDIVRRLFPPISRRRTPRLSRVEWQGEPRDRDLLFAPPLRGLYWDTDEGEEEKISLSFAVDSEGRVTDVHALTGGTAQLIDAATKAMKAYLFESCEAPEQWGTLTIEFRTI